MDSRKSTRKTDELPLMKEVNSFTGDLPRLRDDFERRFNDNRPSESSEKLKEYKFLAILGQGAFGLVVSNLSFFVSFAFTFFSLDRNYKKNF